MTADLLNVRRASGAAVAPAGFVFSAFDHVKHIEREFEVAEACGSLRGRWYCVAHRAALYYEREKELHVDQRGVSNRCLLCWICDEHQGRPESVRVRERAQ